MSPLGLIGMDRRDCGAYDPTVVSTFVILRDPCRISAAVLTLPGVVTPDCITNCTRKTGSLQREEVMNRALFSRTFHPSIGDSISAQPHEEKRKRQTKTQTQTQTQTKTQAKTKTKRRTQARPRRHPQEKASRY